LLFLLGGCSSTAETGEPTCNALASPPEIGACVTPQAGWGALPGRSEESFVIVGTVLEVGASGLPDECQQPPTVSWWNISSPQSAWWFRVTDSQGAVWTVGASVPGSALPVTVGQTVTVEFSWFTCCLNSPVTSVAIRDENADLVLWIGQGNGGCAVRMPAALGSYTPGQRVCTEDDACGDSAAYDLVVSAGGASAPLPHGGEVTVGGIRFIHGGYAEATGPAACPDACRGAGHLAAVAAP